MHNFMVNVHTVTDHLENQVIVFDVDGYSVASKEFNVVMISLISLSHVIIMISSNPAS